MWLHRDTSYTVATGGSSAGKPISAEPPKLIAFFCPQLDAPMSDWFKSIPAALDLVAFAAKVWFDPKCRCVSKSPLSFNKKSCPGRSVSFAGDTSKYEPFWKNCAQI